MSQALGVLKLVNGDEQSRASQLRLQQTVEGLSVAAVSYYVVGLIGYLAKGTHVLGDAIVPELVTAASVPFAIFVVWWLVRKTRRAHDRGSSDQADSKN